MEIIQTMQKGMHTVYRTFAHDLIDINMRMIKLARHYCLKQNEGIYILI